MRDTGIGIAPEDQAAVFEEFRQVGRDYTRKAEGTGLGLALTQALRRAARRGDPAAEHAGQGLDVYCVAAAFRRSRRSRLPVKSKVGFRGVDRFEEALLDQLLEQLVQPDLRERQAARACCPDACRRR